MIEANEKGFIRIVTKKTSEDISFIYDGRETTYKAFDAFLINFDKAVRQNSIIGMELISGTYIAVPVTNIEYVMYVPNALLEKNNANA